jgi:hypothetical protein
MGKICPWWNGQFSLRFWFPPFLVLFLVFFTFNAEFSDRIWPPVAIIYIRSPKPLLLGKIGESQQKLAEPKICRRRNWRISQFLVQKNRKNPFFYNFLFKIPIIPIWPLNSFFSSKTSLYRLKFIFRIKKIAKQIMAPFSLLCQTTVLHIVLNSALNCSTES